MKLTEKIMKAQKNMEMVNSIIPKLGQEIEHYEWYALQAMQDMKYLGSDCDVEEFRVSILKRKNHLIEVLDACERSLDYDKMLLSLDSGKADAKDLGNWRRLSEIIAPEPESDEGDDIEITEDLMKNAFPDKRIEEILKIVIPYMENPEHEISPFNEKNRMLVKEAQKFANPDID